MLKHAVFLVVLFSHNFIALVNGCSCAGGLTLEQSFANATHVFIGKAFRTGPGTQRNEYQVTFQVEKAFKGSIPSNGSITASTSYESASCGVPLRSGEKWQVWTTGANDSPKIQSCSETTKDVTRNIDFLNQHASDRSSPVGYTSSTSRCQQSIAITIASLFTLIEYHVLAPTI